MQRQIIPIGSRKITLFTPESGAAQGAVYLCASAQEAEPLSRALSGLPLALIFIDGIDWNRDLSPWPAPAAFRGGAEFDGGADAWLDELTGRILPQVELQLDAPVLWRALGGYSLAGLFALYAALRTHAFSRIASASGSLWYDGFLDFLRAHPLPTPPEYCYLSFGDRESRGRNPRFRSLEDNTREAARIFAERGAHTAVEVHPGGHFENETGRMERAIRALAVPSQIKWEN